MQFRAPASTGTPLDNLDSACIALTVVRVDVYQPGLSWPVRTKQQEDEPVSQAVAPVSSIDAHIQGDVSGQVAVGSYIVQVGSVSGGVVNIAAPSEQPVPRARPVPVLLRPRPFPG